MTLTELLARPYSVEILHVDEPGTKGYFIAFLPEFGQSACSATADTREIALRKLLKLRGFVFKHYLETNKPLPEPLSFCPKASPCAPWPTRMLVQEIATRVRSAMEVKGLDLFELAEKLNWAPARLLQWIDGSLAVIDKEDAGTLRDLVTLGQALQMRWHWQIGKAAIKVK